MFPIVSLVLPLKKKKQAVKVTGYTFHHVKLEEGNQHVGHIGGYISAQ